MNKVVALVVLIILSTIILTAQDSVLVKSNALQDMKWALQFQVSGVNLYSFQKAENSPGSSYTSYGEVSLQKPLSLNSALRIGVGTSIEKSYTDGVIKNQNNMVSFNVQYLYRPSVDQSVIIYYGAGPGVEYDRQISHTTYNYNYSNGSSYSTYYINDYFSWSIGMDAVVGVEWFATHSISFSGEYYGNLVYKWSNYKKNPNTYSPDVTVTRTVDFTSTTNQVRLGIAGYFNW